MKRNHAAAHENHERWLVSYADFITLLFAFFVVMFASTQADKAKARAVSESVREALENGQFSSAIAVVLGKGKHENDRTAVSPQVDAKTSGAGLKLPEEGVGAPKRENNASSPPDLAQSAETLQRVLSEELKKGKVAIRLEARGLVISLREAGFFASGDDAVSTASLTALGKIAGIVAELPQPVRLEGHTDSMPIHNSRFRSNWELSTARAIAVLELLAGQYHIARGRMAVAGYAENIPADTNDTEEGRAHNRRVDLVLLSGPGLRDEPVAPPAAASPLPRTGTAAKDKQVKQDKQQ